MAEVLWDFFTEQSFKPELRTKKSAIR